jgi:flagellar motility protein MotE (MotC chaperone)
MIFLGVLLVGFRLHDIWESAASGKMFTAIATTQAESKKETPPAPKADAPKSEPVKATEAAKPPRQELDSEERELSESELLLASKLAERRTQLDKREQELLTRESLITVAEQRVDQKIKEMETLRTQLQGMLNQANTNQQQQLDNLVKIYETMKPPEAAKIFEALDQPVLMGVVQRMKPAKTAAIMAQMSPEKAKEITTAMTRQDQLPSIK